MNNLSIPTVVLNSLETSSSIGMFARDTGGCLISRLGLSRSKDESKEISFAELSESAIFYFSAPAMAKLSSKIYSNALHIDKTQLSTPIKALQNTDKNLLKRIKLGKLGQILTTFSIILPFVFGIAPVRNLLTYSETGKNKFVSVVGLKKEDKTKHRQEAKQKAVNLIKKLALISSAGVAAGIGILGLAKNKKTYKVIEPALDKLIKHLDFTKSYDLELAHYGMLIYPVSIASYFYASRDKYEKWENARRFSVTVPLMFFGEKLIQKPIYKKFDKLFNTNVLENNRIKSYKDILKMPLSTRNQHLKSKNFAYGLTFFINTMAIASAVALLNRIETQKKYLRDVKE